MSGPDAQLELARAKVNLWLRVLQRRDDGYHEVETAILELELCDEVRARATDAGAVELTVGGPAASADVPADEGNLVFRLAAAALARGRERGLLPPSAGVALELVKRIPSQAGLGGGSSDAAATLRAIEAVWSMDLGAEWRRRELASAGADCVFFHDVGSSGAATCTGFGELVQPVPGAPPAWSVLVLTPLAECPTAAIFSAWRGDEGGAIPAPRLDPELLRAPAREVRARLRNDLERPALQLVPALAEWRELLDVEGLAHARLTGSGASFFALFDDGEQARLALEGLLASARSRGLAWRFAEVTRARAL